MLHLISRVSQGTTQPRLSSTDCKFYLLDRLSNEKTRSVRSLNVRSTLHLSGLDDKYDDGRQLGGKEDIAGQLLLEIPRTVLSPGPGAGLESELGDAVMFN